MKKNFKTVIMMAFALLVVIQVVSCKKRDVKKIAVDNQFAISLFKDTISLSDIIQDLDSTTTTWMRFRNDSIFACYGDTINGVVKASDFLSKIPNVTFSTGTAFTLPAIDETQEKDTTLQADRFATFPFHYDGYVINQVLLRGGNLEFGFSLEPEIPMLKSIEIFSNQLLMPNGEPYDVVFNYPTTTSSQVNLADCRIVPENDTVAFSAKITFHYEPSMGFQGGDYECSLWGGLNDVRFHTVYGIVTNPWDSTFVEHQEINFGVKGLSGSAHLPVPKIMLTYRNTFGFAAYGDVTKLDFRSTKTGLVTNLLVTDTVDIDIYPTNGQYQSFVVEGFTDYIDALAGYNRLDFNGSVTMSTPGAAITISDTSAVDIIADIEMPFSFKLTDMRYYDTLSVNFSGMGDDIDDVIDDYFDEIDFFIDYNSKIKIDMDMQVYFLRNNHVIDSMFDGKQMLRYTNTSGLNSIDIAPFTGQKLRNIMRSNKVIVDVGASTEQISPDPVMMMESDAMFLRMKVLTKTTELDVDDVL